MADDFADERAYLTQHHLTVYFEDAIRRLLDNRRRLPPVAAGKVDVNAFLKDYFSDVKRESHINGREFSFIHATLHNRRAFLTQIWSKCESSVPIPSTLKEIHSIMLSICPDFPYSLLELATTHIDEYELSLSIDYVTFLRAFQLRLIYEDFINESQQVFRSSSHRLTCHVPTAETSVPQHDNNYRQILYEAFQKLTISNICLCPPLELIEEALRATEKQYQPLNHQKFLIQLAKNEKLTRLIGKEAMGLKQARSIQQQRPIIEPVASIQDETRLKLTSLSTPSTRISSPTTSSTPSLPPLHKNQILVREKPIRQGSPAVNLIPASIGKRSETSTPFMVMPGSAKTTATTNNMIKSGPIETDSDVESRSSDTDT